MTDKSTVRLEDLPETCPVCKKQFARGMKIIKCGICSVFTCCDSCDTIHGNMELGI